MKILVADDESSSRKILGAALTRLGHSVDLVEDGDQAWAALQHDNHADLVVVDWNMPGLSGPEICRRLRHRGGRRYVYAIIVTARQSSQDVALGLEAGADDFIAKPFDPDELRARVRAGQRIVELQAETERSHTYLDTVLANMESGVLLTAASGRVVYANAALARMSGTSVDLALGLTRDDFMRLHTARFEDVDAFLVQLGVGRPIPLDAAVTFEVSKPERRHFRWLGKSIALSEGMGQLDLFADVTAEVAQSRHREELARHDQLTGLYNRHGAEEAFQREMARFRRAHLPLSIVLADIDHFKRVNDTFSHGVGDRVLQEVGRTIASHCRVTDVAIRWGGEELMVLLPDTPLAGALIFAERVRVGVEALHREGLPGVTLSCGAAEVDPNESSIAPAVERADGRLYLAKAAGRNAVR